MDETADDQREGYFQTYIDQVFRTRRLLGLSRYVRVDVPGEALRKAASLMRAAWQQKQKRLMEQQQELLEWRRNQQRDGDNPYDEQQEACGKQVEELVTWQNLNNRAYGELNPGLQDDLQRLWETRLQDLSSWREKLQNLEARWVSYPSSLEYGLQDWRVDEGQKELDNLKLSQRANHEAWQKDSQKLSLRILQQTKAPLAGLNKDGSKMAASISSDSGGPRPTVEISSSSSASVSGLPGASASGSSGSTTSGSSWPRPTVEVTSSSASGSPGASASGSPQRSALQSEQSPQEPLLQRIETLREKHRSEESALTVRNEVINSQLQMWRKRLDKFEKMAGKASGKGSEAVRKQQENRFDHFTKWQSALASLMNRINRSTQQGMDPAATLDVQEVSALQQQYDKLYTNLESSEHQTANADSSATSGPAQPSNASPSSGPTAGPSGSSGVGNQGNARQDPVTGEERDPTNTIDEASAPGVSASGATATSENSLATTVANSVTGEDRISTNTIDGAFAPGGSASDAKATSENSLATTVANSVTGEDRDPTNTIDEASAPGVSASDDKAKSENSLATTVAALNPVSDTDGSMQQLPMTGSPSLGDQELAPLDDPLVQQLQALQDHVNSIVGRNEQHDDVQDPLMQQEVELQTQLRNLVEWQQNQNHDQHVMQRLQDLENWQLQLDNFAEGHKHIVSLHEPYRQQELQRWQQQLQEWTVWQKQWHEWQRHQNGMQQVMAEQDLPEVRQQNVPDAESVSAAEVATDSTRKIDPTEMLREAMREHEQKLAARTPAEKRTAHFEWMQSTRGWQGQSPNSYSTSPVQTTAPQGGGAFETGATTMDVLNCALDLTASKVVFGCSALRYVPHVVIAHGQGAPAMLTRKGGKWVALSNNQDHSWYDFLCEVKHPSLTLIFRLDPAECASLDTTRV